MKYRILKSKEGFTAYRDPDGDNKKVVSAKTLAAVKEKLTHALKEA